MRLLKIAASVLFGLFVWYAVVGLYAVTVDTVRRLHPGDAHVRTCAEMTTVIQFFHKKGDIIRCRL